ncbi:Pr6Pr family membrane protein [Jatrophihabitans telluris]|uniref:Pr6Pr family membrane protein n=1 Tax=Jatrophihabitans telluris TaxID=2038343 RepID=A0ABY4QYE4_9ACTN|nr:Pr6Pr family membrane protein [Jatrophihabitans telluris]UQX88653.1 Pr6Pr family membrane protein [Jatrophihabitans telluris]
MIARLWHAVVALLVLVALVVQVIIAVRLTGSPHDVHPGVLRGSSLIGRLIRLVSFFTIDSNVLCGIVSFQLALRPERDGRWWRPLRLAALFGITVTGIVYSTVLAAIHQPAAGAETFVNTIVHYLVPILMVLGWLLFGPRPRIDVRTIGLSLLFPVAWLAYTLLRGAIWKWYPYPFLDVPSHGYVRVAVNSVAVTLVFGLLAAVFALLDRRLPPAPTRRAAA